MLAGPIDRHVKVLRSGSADLWTGSNGGTGGGTPCASMPRAPSAHTLTATNARTTRFIEPLLFLAEIDLRDRRRRRRRIEVRALFEAEHLGGHVAGEPARRGVVFLDALVVAHPRDGEAVLSAREVCHHTVELLVRPAT